MNFFIEMLLQVLYLPSTTVVKGTLTHIWKSANMFVLIQKQYVEDFTLKHLLLFEICAREIYEIFIYKYSETMEYVKN